MILLYTAQLRLASSGGGDCGRLWWRFRGGGGATETLRHWRQNLQNSRWWVLVGAEPAKVLLYNSAAIFLFFAWVAEW